MVVHDLIKQFSCHGHHSIETINQHNAWCSMFDIRHKSILSPKFNKIKASIHVECRNWCCMTSRFEINTKSISSMDIETINILFGIKWSSKWTWRKKPQIEHFSLHNFKSKYWWNLKQNIWISIVHAENECHHHF